MIAAVGSPRCCGPAAAALAYGSPVLPDSGSGAPLPMLLATVAAKLDQLMTLPKEVHGELVCRGVEPRHQLLAEYGR